MFWSHFENEIDQSEISQVSKFNYLKEMLNWKLESLSSDSKYCKDGEVVNAQIQGLMSLSTIHNLNPKKIKEVYKKIVKHVQALEGIIKFREIKSYMQLISDKLQGNKSDKARINNKMHDWDFETLTKELG